MMQYAALKVVIVVLVTSSVLWDLKRIVSLTICFNESEGNSYLRIAEF